MNFFCDSKLSPQDALNYYINYVKQHNGKISQEFLQNLQIKKIHGNSTLALGNASLKNNTVNLRENSSIITFFHELRHLSDQWRDTETGKKFACWEYEKDYTSQMTFENQANRTVKVIKGIHGRYIGEAVAELYASKVYWEMCGNSTHAKRYTATRNFYDEEIINLKKICTILGIDEDEFLNLKCDQDYARNLMRKRCEQLTGDPRTWDILEDNLDAIEMEKVINVSHPDLKINTASKDSFRKGRQNVKNIYNYILNSSLQRGIVSQNEYDNKVKQLKNLDSYLDFNYR